MARLVPVTVSRVPPLRDEGDGSQGWKFRGPLPRPGTNGRDQTHHPARCKTASGLVSQHHVWRQGHGGGGGAEGLVQEPHTWCWSSVAQDRGVGLRVGGTGFGGAQETSDGGRGVQGGQDGGPGGLPPVDAPLGVDPQDGGVLSVVIFDLGVGELSAVDVDDNGGTAGALPGGRQASDLPGIPPEDAGAGAHLRGHRASRLHHQQAERESPARPLHLPTYGTGHGGPVSRRGPFPSAPARGRVLSVPTWAAAWPSPPCCPAWAGGCPRLSGAEGRVLPHQLAVQVAPPPAPPPRQRQPACPRPSLREPGPRVPRAGLRGGKGLAGLTAAPQRPHQSPGQPQGPSTGGAPPRAGPTASMSWEGWSTALSANCRSAEGRTRHTHPPPPSSLI